MNATPWTIVVRINGQPHRVEQGSEGFYADSPELPCRRCSFHRLSLDSLHRACSQVLAGGNVYEFSHVLGAMQ